MYFITRSFFSLLINASNLAALYNAVLKYFLILTQTMAWAKCRGRAYRNLRWIKCEIMRMRWDKFTLDGGRKMILLEEMPHLPLPCSYLVFMLFSVFFQVHSCFVNELIQFLLSFEAGHLDPYQYFNLIFWQQKFQSIKRANIFFFRYSFHFLLQLSP